MKGLGGFLSGLAGGAVMGMQMSQSQAREKRAEEAEKRSKEEHDLKKAEFERRRQESMQQGQALVRLSALVEEYNPRPADQQTPQMGGINPAPPAAQPVEGAEASPVPPGNSVANVTARTGIRSAQAGPADNPQQANAAAADAMVDQLVKKEGISREEAQQVLGQAGNSIVSDRIGYGIFRNPNVFKDPSFARRASQIFLETPGMGEAGMRWLERSAQATEEGSIDALKRLIGGDPRGAEESFNASGKARVVPGSAREVSNGKWEIQVEGGKTQTFDPRQMLRSYLKPDEFFKLEMEEGKARSQAQQHRDSAGARDRQLTEQERHNRATEQKDSHMVVPEGGTVASRRTGLPIAAGGINPGGAPGAAPPSRRQEAHVDSRVKLAIDKVILPKYGGRFEGGMFFPDDKNKDVALRAQVLAEQFIVKQGMDPVAAGNKAINQAENDIVRAFQTAWMEYEQSEKSGFFGDNLPVKLPGGKSMPMSAFIMERARQILSGTEQAVPEPTAGAPYTGPRPWAK